MIKLIKSSFYNEAKTKNALVKFIKKAPIFSMNKECKKFEIQFAKKQKRKHALFVSSGSMANLVLIQALINLGKLKKNDVVGVSALTWPTNIMPLIQLGLGTKLIDCELETLNISPTQLKQHIGSIKALFITNVLGLSDRLDKIRQICKQNNILLIEDNCESLGSVTAGRLLGNFGLASTFSFFVGHHMSTIEGGMICTDDDELFDMLTMVRAHGWDRNLPEKSKQKLRKLHKVNDFFALYTFYTLAYNARPTEINGFIGNKQLPYLDKIVSTRARNFKSFHQIASQNSDIIPLKLDHMDVISNFAMPIIFRDEKTFQMYRERFIKHKVEVRPIIAGDMAIQPFYRKYAKKQASCPNSLIVHHYGFYFGNNPELTKKEIALICKLLKK
ncbi:MAG: aminotransferase class V-fold PLP-dependent enzyme [Patescibacteria group bacterium]